MSYYEFAEIYDDLMDDVPYEKWADFIKKNIGRNKTILEAACGTGNITRLLAEDDYKITAFDLSQEMLVKAYEKLRRYTNVEILNMDMKSFRIKKHYDAAISCCDGLNYLLSEEDLLKFFNNIYGQLNANGIFIFDFSTIYKFENHLSNNTIVSEENNVFMVWENSYNINDNSCEMEINFFVKTENELYSHIHEYQKQRAFKVEYIIDMLENIGFTDIKAFSGYSFDKYKNDDDRIVIVCKKES